MPEIMPEIIMDTCVLSNFALSQSLFILKSCYSYKIYITSFALAEIMKGIQRGYEELTEVKKALTDGWLIETHLKTAKEMELFERLIISLGTGESSSISVSKSRGFTFASDDLRARREAALLNVPLTGTIGILVKAVKSKVITVQRGETILARMKEHGFYAPISSIRKI